MRSAGPATLLARFGDPLAWSVTGRCALVLGIYLVFSVWALAAGLQFLRHPDLAPYLAPDVLAIEVRLLGIQVVLLAAVLAWAISTRRSSAPRPPVLYATAALTLLTLLHGAYVYGTQTRLYTAAAVCGSVAVAAVMFERRVVRGWTVVLMLALALVTLGEVTGVVPYAPLLSRPPVFEERLAVSWMLGGGGISLAILCVVVVLIYQITQVWHERGNQLADVTDQLAREARFRDLIDAIDDGVLVVDPGRGIVAANAAFAARTGRPVAALVSCSSPEVRAALACPPDCPVQACLARGERTSRVWGRPLANGDVAWEEVHCSPLVDESGRVVRVVEVWRDITARRRAQAALAESHRLDSLGMLASGFSHELNAPLATVLTCVEGILRVAGSADGDQHVTWQRVGRNAGIAREQLLRCRGITQHFLRLASGKATPSEVLDVGALLARVVRLIAPTAQARNVTIQIAPLAAATHVRAVAPELDQVVLNLLLNAIAASPPGGVVRLAVAGRDPVRIRVRDGGSGIARADQARIFEPFCSLRAGGTGLGLFFARGFAQRAGGDIRVASAPGAGATFEVLLPGLITPAGQPARP